MRWITFSILALLAIGAQTTLAPQLGYNQVQPDVVVILLVYYALYARQLEGLWAGWLLGLGVDLASVERLGIVTAFYALAAGGIWLMRGYVFCRHPRTYFAVALVAGFLLRLALQIFTRMTNHGGMDIAGIVLICLASALYTAVLGVLLHRLVLRYSMILGFHRGSSPLKGRRMGLNLV